MVICPKHGEFNITLIEIKYDKDINESLNHLFG